MSDTSYIIKWYRSNDFGISWTIRGLRPHGAFYGEWLKYKARRGGTFTGQLGDGENSQLQKLFASLLDLIDTTTSHNDLTPPNTMGAFRGAIASGIISMPNVLLRYHIGSEAVSPASALFLEIVQFLDPRMDPFIP